MTKRKVKSHSKGEGGFVDTQGSGQEHVLQSRIRGVALVAPVANIVTVRGLRLENPRWIGTRCLVVHGISGNLVPGPEVRCKIPPISPQISPCPSFPKRDNSPFEKRPTERNFRASLPPLPSSTH